MATLDDVKLSCAVELERVNAASTAINDLGDEIEKAITDTIRFYNRQPWHLTELHDMRVATVADTEAYSTVDLDPTASGDQSITGRDTVDVNTITEVHYIEGPSWRLIRERFRTIRRWQQFTSVTGEPTNYALYAGQLFLYPVPDAVYAIKISGTIKPPIPSSGSENNVWFDEARELIEAGANKRMCLKHLRDRRRAADFAAIENEAADNLAAEYTRKSSSGRIMVHD